MNILSREFIKKLAEYPELILLKPAMTHTGQFVPVDFSRGIFGDPEVLKMASDECAWLIDFLKIEVVAGIELAGVPLATAIAIYTERPLIMVRDPQKRPGRPAVVGAVNFLNGTERVLLVDDLIAYGGTKVKRAEQIASAGGLVTHTFALLDFPIISAIDRNEHEIYEYNGRQVLAQKGIHTTSLLTWKELVTLQKENGTISEDLAVLACAMLDPDNFQNNNQGWLSRFAELCKRELCVMPPFAKEYLAARGVSV